MASKTKNRWFWTALIQKVLQSIKYSLQSVHFDVKSYWIKPTSLVNSTTVITLSLGAKDLNGVNIVKFKTFLKLKNISYSENHSCLIIQIPGHLLAGTNKPDIKVKGVMEFMVRKSFLRGCLCTCKRIYIIFSLIKLVRKDISCYFGC